MAPATAAGLIPRKLGHAVFLVWCGMMVVAISVVGLARVGWLAAGGGRRSPPT